LKGTKKPIGGRNYFETTFENHTFQYEKGTRIFFFSDGITDQMGGPLGRKLGTKRFVELVAATSTLSIDNQAKAIEQFMVQWQGALPQQDDMLLFILEMA
jgi:serine phosphatase RsbU (regulator of sigma subunit)